MGDKEAFEKMMNKRWPTWNDGGKHWSPTMTVMLERAFLDGVELERKRHLTPAALDSKDEKNQD